MPGWLGPWEILIVVVIILLIFGGRLLPRLGRSLGGSITGLRKGVKEGSEEFKTAIQEDEAAAEDAKAKVDSAAQTPPQSPAGTAAPATRPELPQTRPLRAEHRLASNRGLSVQDDLSGVEPTGCSVPLDAASLRLARVPPQSIAALAAAG